MTSYYVTVSIKVFLNVGNDEYIILCNFGGRSIMSGFEVIDGGLQEPCPRSQKKKEQQQQTKKAGLNGVNSKALSFVSRFGHLLQCIYNRNILIAYC